MTGLLLIALATLVSEDLTSIGTGVLIAQGRLGFLEGTAACLIGIYGGDLLLFLAGRFAGSWRLLRKLVPPQQLDRASLWLDQRGAPVIFLSRFVPGARLPTYFAAGLLRMRFWRFALYFLIAAAVWTPLLVGLTVWLGARALETALLAGSRGSLILLAAAATWIAARKLLPRLVRPWEFWPPWAAYLPLVPYFVWLALKHRSLTLFTAANPGVRTGGFTGESKSEILRHLDRAAAYTVIGGSLGTQARLRRASEFLERCGLGFPVVLKPDTGERGAGVAVVRSRAGLEAYLSTASGDTILQQYVDGPEFGVFYVRYPNEVSGKIVSITDKRFPEVIGDGRSTIPELIQHDARARHLASVYLGRLRRPAGEVPAPGEAVRLTELGSHCRGAVFLDGTHLRTPALEAAIDRVSKGHPGFYFGRYDVRAASVEAFQAGEFRVLELNGVTAEATHIYDPAVSVIDAYRTMFRLWRTAFEIGAINRARGAMPASAIDLLAAIRKRSRRPISAYARTVQAVD